MKYGKFSNFDSLLKLAVKLVVAKIHSMAKMKPQTVRKVFVAKINSLQ